MATRKPPTEVEEEPECDCCGFTGPVGGMRTYPRVGFGAGATKALCPLCAGTMAGIYYDASHGSDVARILETICYVGNAILKAMEARSEATFSSAQPLPPPDPPCSPRHR